MDTAATTRRLASSGRRGAALQSRSMEIREEGPGRRRAEALEASSVPDRPGL